jgi:hypothetical protein
MSFSIEICQKQSRGGESNMCHPEYNHQSSVIGEELQNKIEENAQLHRQVWLLVIIVIILLLLLVLFKKYFVC